MLEKGIEIDIETGRPATLIEEERKIEREKRIRRAIEEGQSLVNELKGQDGGELIRNIAILLETGINDLMKLNVSNINEMIKIIAECQTYLKLLNRIGYKINIGKSIAEREIGGITEKR